MATTHPVDILSKLALAACLAMIGAACSPVQNVQIRDDYAKVDRTSTYRVHFVTAPLPAGKTKLGILYSAIGTRYVNSHRDFIVRKASAQKTASKADCTEKIEAVLWLEPKVSVKGGNVDVSVRGELRRCHGWVPIWSAQLRDTWPSNDDQLSELTKQYTSDLGAIAKTHAAPAFRALRLLLDTLPKPKLIKESDIDEKIEL
ncbi:MAG: MXAN_6521/LA_1396 family lipoprotein [Myxococcales bacterium]|nr:MXAN_6521/LA_1396 family lipoprotein [Myxococcales bacterium]